MKKIIIVCEDKCKPYGNFLAQLISSDDDTTENVIGVRDGEVSASVWTEKQFSDNAIQLSSMQHVLFIGNSKLMKEKRINMNENFNKFGMKYCWLGKQAALYVDKIVEKEDYDNFLEYAKNNNANIESKLELKKEVPFKELENKNSKNKFEEMLFSAQKVANIVSNKVTNLSIEGFNNFNKLSKNSEIEQQEYNCLITEFYLNGLSEFLGMKEE